MLAFDLVCLFGGFVSTFLGLEHIDCVQGSDEWKAMRLGVFTASRACAAMKRNAPTKTGPGPYSAKRRHLATGLALERVTGLPAYEKPFTTDAMSRGIELEPAARYAYTERIGVELVETGFWRHPTLMLGASYDGLSPDLTRAVECKALYPSNHLEIALAVHEGAGWGAIPEEYQWQVTHLLAWMPTLTRLDFVVYCPEFTGDASLVVIPVERDEPKLSEYRGACEEFLALTDEVERKIRMLGGE